VETNFIRKRRKPGKKDIIFGYNFTSAKKKISKYIYDKQLNLPY
jgi:hypothetical protein